VAVQTDAALTEAWTADLLAARMGDRAALERVLRRSRQDLRRYAEFHCEVNDVEDAVQDALFTVSRKLGGLRELERFASWLFRIVKRECNRYKRARNALRQVPISEDIAGPDYPETKGLALDLARAMQLLPPHYREILLLRDLEGHSIEELARELALTTLAAKARLHRARSLAREYLDA
jgi:RNA polymerase sigma factor (sigma-70 family)